MDRLLDTHEAAALLGFTESTLKRWRSKGTGPAYVKVNGYAVRYRQSALDEWIKAGQAETLHRGARRRLY